MEMVYEKTVQFLTGYIAGELNLSAKEKDRVRYGLEVFISTLITLVVSLIIAYLFNNIYTVLFILISGALLKTLAGGIHLKTVYECTFFTAFFANSLGVLNTYLSGSIYKVWPYYIIFSFLFIEISLFLWSPAEVPEKPIRDKRKKIRLKYLSILVSFILLISVALSFYFYQERYLIINTSIVTGLLFQVLNINPMANRLQSIYYRSKYKLDDGN